MMKLTIFKTQNGCIVIRGGLQWGMQSEALEMIENCWSFHSWQAAIEKISELLQEWESGNA